MAEENISKLIIEKIKIFNLDGFSINENAEEFNFDDINKAEIFQIDEGSEVTFIFDEIGSEDPLYNILLEELENNEDSLILENSTTVNDANLLLEDESLKLDKSLSRIKINFGDDSSETHFRNLEELNNKDWLIFKHVYKFDRETFTENTYKTAEIYFTFIDRGTIVRKIHFNVLLSSNDGKLDLSLINANLTNNKKISYIFNDNSNKQLILAKTSDKISL